MDSLNTTNTYIVWGESKSKKNVPRRKNILKEITYIPNVTWSGVHRSTSGHFYFIQLTQQKNPASSIFHWYGHSKKIYRNYVSSTHYDSRSQKKVHTAERLFACKSILHTQGFLWVDHFMAHFSTIPLNCQSTYKWVQMCFSCYKTLDSSVYLNSTRLSTTWLHLKGLILRAYARSRENMHFSRSLFNVHV